jgi:large subunit ribosomal protein L6
MKEVYSFSGNVSVEFRDDSLIVSALGDNEKSSKFVGLHRSNLNNIVKGLAEGFKLVLEYNGVGYKVNVVGNFLVLGLGYSHDIAVKIPKTIQVTPEKPNLIVMKGHDKIALGRFAAFVKSLRKTEPYKGKGIKFQGEKILRKEGKKK